MKSIGNLIQSELASYRPVVLPGVGTLSVKRIGAEMSGDKIQAPVNVVDFTPHEQAGENIIVVMQSIGLSHEEARSSYDQWLEQMRSGDSIIIESVGVLSGSEFRADPQMEELINPDGARTRVGAKPAAEVKEAARAAEKPNGNGKDGKKKGKAGVVLWFIFVIALLAILCFLLMRRCESPEYTARREKARTERVQRQEQQRREREAAAAQASQSRQSATAAQPDTSATQAGATGNPAADKEGTNGTTAPKPAADAKAGNATHGQTQDQPGAQKTSQNAQGTGQKPAATTTGTSKFPAYRQGVPMYYVIAGAFGEEANADKLINKYRQRGIDAEVVPVKKGHLTMVALYASESLSEVNRKRAEFQRTLDPSMYDSFWVYTRK